jgi:hypothetical protein
MPADKIVSNGTAAAPGDALFRQRPCTSFRKVSSCEETEEAGPYGNVKRDKQGTSDSAEEASSLGSVDNQGGELIQWRQQNQTYEECRGNGEVGRWIKETTEHWNAEFCQMSQIGASTNAEAETAHAATRRCVRWYQLGSRLREKRAWAAVYAAKTGKRKKLVQKRGTTKEMKTRVWVPVCVVPVCNVQL